MSTKIRVAINGYGVIGKRVADAVQAQPDMEMVDKTSSHHPRRWHGHKPPA